MKRTLKTSFLALLCLGSLAACGADHRTEDFCDMLCSCSSANEGEQAQCTAQCTVFIEDAEVSAGVSPISDECYACVNNNSCQAVETSCDNACSSLQDALNQQQPDQGESI